MRKIIVILVYVRAHLGLPQSRYPLSLVMRVQISLDGNMLGGLNSSS